MKATAVWAVAVAISAGIGSFKWIPPALDNTQQWASEPGVVAVNDLAQLVMGLEVLDIRKEELMYDAEEIEDNIKAMELAAENPDISESHKLFLQRQLELERKRLYQIRQRLDHNKESDRQIIRQLETSLA